MVPVDKNMTKIKIDFLLNLKRMKKIDQQLLPLKILIVIKYMLNIIKSISYII